MKKFNKIIAVALPAALALGACNDLDTTPMGNFVTQTQKDEVVKLNPSMIDASVQGISSMFSVYGNALGQDYHNDFGYPSLMLFTDTRCFDVVSDDIGYNWYSAQVTYSDLKENSVLPIFAWRTFYNQIRSANAVIATIDPETEDTLTKFYLAQGLAFRAFDYFMCAQLYCAPLIGNESGLGLPLLTPENAEESATMGLKRSTLAETYEFIHKDLTTAIELLSTPGVVNTKSGREGKRYISLAVAHGLRARVNLAMHKWSDAATDAQAAIEKSGATPYTIAEAGHPAFINAADPSWMWAVLIEINDRVVTTGICNFPSMMGSLTYGYASVGAWRRINKSLYASIPSTDVRQGWFLDVNGQSANLDPEQQAYVTGYGCPAFTQVKYAPYNGELGTSTNASDFPLMRVEEMYLTLAEAQAMGLSAATGAQTLTDFVKTYRDPAYAFSSTDATAVQEEVWRQRRIELWGEGFSYFDMRRLQKPMDRRGAGYEPTAVFNIPSNDPVLIFRIPSVERQANKLCEPNPLAGVPVPVEDF